MPSAARSAKRLRRAAGRSSSSSSLSGEEHNALFHTVASIIFKYEFTFFSNDTNINKDQARKQDVFFLRVSKTQDS